MATESNGNGNGVQTREEYIDEAVQAKKNSLEGEMAAFKACKDQEFRAFEAFIRRWPGEPTAADAETHVKSLGLRYKIKKPKMMKGVPPANKKHQTDESILANMHVGFVCEGTLGSDEERTLKRIHAKRKAEQKREQAHEREKEFEGVITPSYLPLLGSDKEGDGNDEEEVLANPLCFSYVMKKADGKIPPHQTRNQKDRDQTSTSQHRPPPLQPSSLANALRTPPSSQPHLSSSAECQSRAPPLISPPRTPSRPLSSSVPPEHESSTSQPRSPVSIDSLKKSSLKDPSSGPKSPKKVQFSIDDKVVSPSSSPCVMKKGSSDGVAAREGKDGEKFEVMKGRSGGDKSWENGAIAGISGIRHPSSSTLNNSSLSNNNTSSPFSTYVRGPSPTISSTSPFSSFNHPTFTTSFYGAPPHPSSTPSSSNNNHNNSIAPITTTKDFDILSHPNNEGGEDVFPFDEDIHPALPTPAQTQSQQPSNLQDDDPTTEDDVGPDLDENPPLTSSSPHAGSLPIEIRLPMRGKSGKGRGRGGGFDDDEDDDDGP